MNSVTVALGHVMEFPKGSGIPLWRCQVREGSVKCLVEEKGILTREVQYLAKYFKRSHTFVTDCNNSSATEVAQLFCLPKALYNLPPFPG